MDLIITFKNCPPITQAYLEAALKLAPSHTLGRPIELSSENLEVDFNKIDEPVMSVEVTEHLSLFLQAAAYLQLKKIANESGAN